MVREKSRQDSNDKNERLNANNRRPHVIRHLPEAEKRNGRLLRGKWSALGRTHQVAYQRPWHII
jgi:hypothetical protein